jgi:hypothetical protein
MQTCLAKTYKITLPRNVGRAGDFPLAADPIDQATILGIRFSNSVGNQEGYLAFPPLAKVGFVILEFTKSTDVETSASRIVVHNPH